MAIPTKNIKKVQLNPNDDTTIYEIVPEKISDGNGNVATLPVLTQDEIIALKSDIDALPEPMVFKGGATITKSGSTYTISVTNPSSASNIKEGYTYKIISAPSNDENFKAGDTLIADKNNPGSNPQTNWTLIPSGDEPSGTVTSVGLSMPTGFTVSGSPITSNGIFTVALASGYSLLNSNSEQTIAGAKKFTSPLTLYAASGDSPMLIFQRGTLTDTYNDWGIVDSGGFLYFKQRGNGSTDWSDTRIIMAQSYTDIKGEIRENGTSLTNKYVRHDTNAQGLTETQKQNARDNIGAGEAVLIRRFI